MLKLNNKALDSVDLHRLSYFSLRELLAIYCREEYVRLVSSNISLFPLFCFVLMFSIALYEIFKKISNF